MMSGGIDKRPAAARHDNTEGGDIQEVTGQGGVSGGGPRPHIDRIQQLFGQHNVSGIRATAESVFCHGAHREESVATASEVAAERPYLLALARRLALSPLDAHDLVQDTIVKALPALGKVTTGSHLRAWLLTILRRMHVDRLRRVAREPETISIEDALDRLVADAPVSEVADASSADDIWSALREIPMSFREVLVLHELEGRSYREVAHTLDLPLATVGTRLRRARLKLRQVIVARRTNRIEPPAATAFPRDSNSADRTRVPAEAIHVSEQ
jgi:RNA polymerase sigma-70 factor (ECF subfamily)